MLHKIENRKAQYISVHMSVDSNITLSPAEEQTGSVMSPDELRKKELLQHWRRCYQSYVRDFMVEHSNFKRERSENPGIAPMHMKAFGGRAAILKRRVRINKDKNPVMRLYKCVDIESSSEMMDSGVLPQQSDDLMKCVITNTDLTLENTIYDQFSGDDDRCEIYLIDVRKLLEEGWTPMYDRGFVYWYPPITPEYLYGAPEFNIDHLPEQCIDY